MEKIIQISHLSKSFGEVKAVQDLSFCVKKGELFAFLGLNGAGKSTTISILCGQLQKDGGMVEINGKNVDEAPLEIKRELGVVFQNSVMDKTLSVYDNLKTRAALYHLTGKAFEERLQTLVELFDLQEILKRPLGKLSGGQCRRVDVVRALLHKPSILILDEPTTGLHAYDVDKLIKILLKLREGGNTVLVIEHNLDVIKTADHIIDLGPEGGNGGGTVVCTGTPEEVAKNTQSYTGKFLKNVL